jgi:hypothetical protein
VQFNTWNYFGCDINETVVLDTADRLLSTGLAASGYVYVNLDGVPLHALVVISRHSALFDTYNTSHQHTTAPWPSERLFYALSAPVL